MGKQGAKKYVVLVIRERNAHAFTITSTSKEKALKRIEEEIAESTGVKSYKILDVTDPNCFKDKVLMYPKEILRKEIK